MHKKRLKNLALMINIFIKLGTEGYFLNLKNTHLNAYRFYAKIIKCLQENIEEKLHSTGFGNDFLHQTPETHATKIRIF